MKFLSLITILFTLFALPAFSSITEKENSFVVKEAFAFNTNFQKLNVELLQGNLEPGFTYSYFKSVGLICESNLTIIRHKHLAISKLGKSNSIPLTKYAYFLSKRWFV